MAKPRMIFHSLVKDQNNIGLLKRTLQNLGHDVSFIFDTKETLQISEDDIDVIILEPSMLRWQWLDVLIKTTRDHPDLPVILYSPEIAVENGFVPISEDMSVFLANDVRILKEKLKELIGMEENSKKKVLFVDDDANVLNSYRRILHKTPWKVLTAPSAEKALEILQKEQIHLVVTDIKMPQIHGIELVSKIRQNYKNLPIVMCLAYPGMKDDHSLKFHEIAAFLEKPVDPDVLESKLQELLS